MKELLVLLALFVQLSRPCFAQFHAKNVVADGVTEVSIPCDGGELRALVSTMVAPRMLPNSATADFAQCTSSRTPCVLTRSVNLVYGKKEVFVPRSAFADLGDIFTVALNMSHGRALLTLTGGDASEAYVAKLQFTRDRVIRRVLYGAEDLAHPVEVSEFHVVSSKKQ